MVVVIIRYLDEQEVTEKTELKKGAPLAPILLDAVLHAPFVHESRKLD
jgi:hypothetical protein